MTTRAGRYQRHSRGYDAFIPEPLPPDPPLRWTDDLLSALSEADRALGRLNGVSRSLPNPDLFVAMYVRREALYSSEIEGIHSTIDDLLAHEVSEKRHPADVDVTAIYNHVQAMNLGLNLLSDLRLSRPLITAVHRQLLQGVRGQGRNPGEIRRTQNWIGPEGCTIDSAHFVPPPPENIPEAMADLEDYLGDRTAPPLVVAGLTHAQFETIHPFGDGNGRVGRLLITLYLAHRGLLHKPLLYPSLYLKQNRLDYYERLNMVRHRGDWEGWLRFFLDGIRIAADDAADTAIELSTLRDDHLRLVSAEHLGRYAVPLLDLLAEQPQLTIKYATEQLGTTPATTTRLLERMQDLRIVTEITGQRRNRVYGYTAFLDILTVEDDRRPRVAPAAPATSPSW
jgi:Fic family protein